jgi:hypothetical protein
MARTTATTSLWLRGAVTGVGGENDGSSCVKLIKFDTGAACCSLTDEQ